MFYLIRVMKGERKGEGEGRKGGSEREGVESSVSIPCMKLIFRKRKKYIFPSIFLAHWKRYTSQIIQIITF